MNTQYGKHIILAGVLALGFAAVAEARAPMVQLGSPALLRPGNQWTYQVVTRDFDGAMSEGSLKIAVEGEDGGGPVVSYDFAFRDKSVGTQVRVTPEGRVTHFRPSRSSGFREYRSSGPKSTEAARPDGEAPGVVLRDGAVSDLGVESVLTSAGEHRCRHTVERSESSVQEKGLNVVMITTTRQQTHRWLDTGASGPWVVKQETRTVVEVRYVHTLDPTLDLSHLFEEKERVETYTLVGTASGGPGPAPGGPRVPGPAPVPAWPPAPAQAAGTVAAPVR
ncbi:MAG: hypothetical protein KA419_10465 [Acidobacteria bacterium]|nr:hypothetical protein [Acidobacteriota bacterium]